MSELEQVVGLFMAAVLLAAAARRVGAPYPVFLAVGGALLAFLPGARVLNLPPELALALFVAPVLLDAAYDASLRDLKNNWLPVASLVVVAVILTTTAVAMVAHALAPGLPWAAAVALGAIVAPPDAVAATTVLRQLRPPHRILTILEGESLLNDATALLIFRVAVGAADADGFSFGAVGPAFLLGVAGSIVVGPTLGWLTFRLILSRVQHIPTSVILQFVTTFSVWIVAERIGLSGVLTMVCYAITVARAAPAKMPAQNRIPSYAVWETVVFALNILAFIFIGLQIRPILESLDPADRGRYAAVAGALVATVILVRIAWQMSFNLAAQWLARLRKTSQSKPRATPSFKGGLLISWSGMRGIVTLAGALALPSNFPYRNLVVLTAFSVVLGTLVIQGLTLKPLLRWLNLHDDNPVGREAQAAREKALRAALDALDGDRSVESDLVRRELKTRFAPAPDGDDGRPMRAAHHELHQRALRAARQTVIELRRKGEIGDDAFHLVEEDLDWFEMSDGKDGA